MRQRGDHSWLLTAYVGWDGVAKKRRYVTRTVHGTRRDAERALADFVSEVNKQRVAITAAGSRQLTVKDVLDQWLEARRQVLSPSTVDRYRVAIKHVVASSVGALPVTKLRPHHIEDLYTSLLSQGQSGSSIRKVHWAMRQSLAWAHRRGYTILIATDGVELPPLGERSLAPPDSAHVRALVEHLLAEDPDWGTAIAFVAWTGCRRGEVCGLRWSDLDFDGQSVLISRSVVSVPGGVQIKGTKTGEMRRLALGSKTVGRLHAHQERCAERARACGTELGSDAYVFSPTLDGGSPYNPHTLTRVFVAACGSAGVPRMRLHDLRHHSATALLKSGSSVGEVMDRHGWRTVEMVNRYRHLLDARDAGAAERLENM
jgi:integrase